MGKKGSNSILDIDEKAKRYVEQVGEADILVGIPSYNNSATISNVLKAVEYGLAKYFPKFKATIVVSDGGSTDGTKEIVKQTSIYSELDAILIRHRVHPASQIVTAYHGIPGKGSAFKAVFEIARELGVKVCVTVDADLRSITPEWIELLAGPIILKKYDYVSPLYIRDKYDGTITNMLIYPLTRALYGSRVRQPIGGDFGFSKNLLKRYVEEDVWGTDIARFGIDIWMTTLAINENFKICQSFLGTKIHASKDPASSLGLMFKQVTGTVFNLMEKYQEHWKYVKGSKPTAIYGFNSEVYPEPVKVNLQSMIESYKKSFIKYREFVSRFLDEETMKELKESASLEAENYSFPSELWAKVVYDLAAVFHCGLQGNKVDLELLLKPIFSFYLGRTASFVIETKDMPTFDAENLIEQQCATFEKYKPYLLKKWGG